MLRLISLPILLQVAASILLSFRFIPYPSYILYLSFSFISCCSHRYIIPHTQMRTFMSNPLSPTYAFLETRNSSPFRWKYMSSRTINTDWGGYINELLSALLVSSFWKLLWSSTLLILHIYKRISTNRNVSDPWGSISGLFIVWKLSSQNAFRGNRS